MSLFSPVPFELAFRAAALKYGVPWAMMAGMAAKASGYDPRATGPTDDRGLMQVIGSNAAGCGVAPDDLYDPATNLNCAASLLRKHFDRIRPYAASRADLWRLVMFANNMGWGNTKGKLEPLPKPVTWEAFKAATSGYPSKHAWVEKMFGESDRLWRRDIMTWTALGLGVAAAVTMWVSLR